MIDYWESTYNEDGSIMAELPPIFSIRIAKCYNVSMHYIAYLIQIVA